MKTTTFTLATETTNLTFQQTLGFVKDLIGDAGYKASAKDLFTLVSGGRNGMYEKLVFKIASGPIEAFAVQKVGMIYTITLLKHNGVEYHTGKATTLINLIENYKPSEQEIDLETFRGKNLIKLREALNKSEKERGKHAKVQDVLRHLVPELAMKSGSYKLHTTLFTVKFVTLLGYTIAELTDSNGFTTQLNMAKDLRRLIGY